MSSVRYYDWIAHFGRRTPDKIAAHDLASDRRLSYAQFDARISRLAIYLRDTLKVARGDFGSARADTVDATHPRTLLAAAKR
jgi:fatty-acyl-CoA synthase